jgi:hypothetical protein
LPTAPDRLLLCAVMPNDPLDTNPELYSLVFENDRVRVLEYRDEPGERTKPHSHPDSVMLTLSAFRRRLVAGGRQAEVSSRQVLCAGCRPRNTRARTSARPKRT